MSSAWLKRINEDLSHPFHAVWLPAKDQGVSQVESERMILPGFISELFRTAVRSGFARFRRSEELGGRGRAREGVPRPPCPAKSSLLVPVEGGEPHPHRMSELLIRPSWLPDGRAVVEAVPDTSVVEVEHGSSIVLPHHRIP